MDFSLNDEQKMMIETVRRFIAEELQPLEDEVEDNGFLDNTKAQAIHDKAKALGLYGMNMPVELGGGAADADHRRGEHRGRYRRRGLCRLPLQRGRQGL